ncbi:unnamed protein product [Dovyalis caffra]|uniref:Uncharacterized protein n=1 Tax=Dovyalis caffra TaxID=77055 RepID=A0AAV1SUS3_9ROSI|nr:unnamed protein product [Dovyalis caffra]
MLGLNEEFSEVLAHASTMPKVSIDSPDSGSDDGATKDEKSSAADTDQWSSSPYMDHFVNQAKSTDLSSQLYSLVRRGVVGQRVQDKGADSFDIDMVKTFLSVFLAKGQISHNPK